MRHLSLLSRFTQVRQYRLYARGCIYKRGVQVRLSLSRLWKLLRVEYSVRVKCGGGGFRTAPRVRKRVRNFFLERPSFYFTSLAEVMDYTH